MIGDADPRSTIIGAEHMNRLIDDGYAHPWTEPVAGLLPEIVLYQASWFVATESADWQRASLTVSHILDGLAACLARIDHD